MKATELRIRNLIKWDDESSDIVSVTAINVDHRGECAIGTDKNELAEIGEFTPIPLIEEWLVKFGFNVKESVWYSIKTKNRWIRFEVCIKEKRCILFDTRKITFCDILFPKYVHQLQNLYFTLTGEELK